MRASWLSVAVACSTLGCSDKRPPGAPDAAAVGDAAVTDAPQTLELTVDRATSSVLQPGISLHSGDGAVWVRASTGMFRSVDEGETWTKVLDGATSAIEIGADGTLIATRVTGGSGSETVTVERHANGSTTPLEVPASFPAVGRWTAATAELDGNQLYLSLSGRADATTLAPAQLLVSPNRGDTFVTLPGPPNAADVTAWGMRACDDALAVWPLEGASTDSYVYREGSWSTLVARPVLDIACTTNDMLLVSTYTGSDSRVYRIAWDDGGTRSETYAPVAHPLYKLAVGPDGKVSSISPDATTIYTSTNHGGTFSTRTVPAPLSALAPSQLARSMYGVWSMATGFPTWIADLGTSWGLRGLPGDGLSYAVDIGFVDQRFIAAMYVHPLSGGAAGYFLFASDQGFNWQLASKPDVEITCMSVSSAGVFLGGAGDDTGVKWAVHDTRGVEVLASGIVGAIDDTVAVNAPIIGCGWISAGMYSTVYVAQTDPRVLPLSRVRSHEPWGTTQLWTTHAYIPDPDSEYRVTALDMGGMYLRIHTAWEKLVPTPGGYDVQAYRGLVEQNLAVQVTNEIDPAASSPGDRAAIRLSGSTALYPGNRIVENQLHPVKLIGLPADATIMSARTDSDGTLWLATTAGIYRRVVPIGL